MNKKLLYFALLNAFTTYQMLHTATQTSSTTTETKSTRQKFKKPTRAKGSRVVKNFITAKIRSSNIKNADGTLDEILLNLGQKKIVINATYQGAAKGKGILDDATGTCTLYQPRANKKWDKKTTKPTSPNSKPDVTPVDIVKTSIGSLSFSLDGKNLNTTELKKLVDEKATDKIVATFTPAATLSTTTATSESTPEATKSTSSTAIRSAKL